MEKQRNGFLFTKRFVTGHAYLKIRTTKALCAVYQDNDLVKATVTPVAVKGLNRKRNTKQEVGWNLDFEAGAEFICIATNY